MHTGKLVFAQLMEHAPLPTFRRCVAKYPGKYPTLSFSHRDQYLCMVFAQLTFRESLRDIETCLRAHATKLYHLGIRGGVARSTLADANEKRDWRIYRDFALALIQIARRLYANDGFGVELVGGERKGCALSGVQSPARCPRKTAQPGRGPERRVNDGGPPHSAAGRSR